MFVEDPLHQIARLFFNMLPPFEQRPAWLKGRGYLHITPKLDIFKRYREIYLKVKNPDFVAKHAFFPLIHSVIKERKYKKYVEQQDDLETKEQILRAHSHEEKGVIILSAKQRPLHYATHIDSMIFGCYAEFLQQKYESALLQHTELKDCVTAYRKIEIEGDDKHLPGKSTIHFAQEAFAAIAARGQKGCVVLMFDIKSFFSELNHDHLKRAWCSLFNFDRLPPDHFNVYKACTEFRYILLDDLRLQSGHRTKRGGLDEKKLASIRKDKGYEAFFTSVEEFRTALKHKNITVYKHPFVKNKRPIGIPQGLPISAVLANLYLLEFDKEILHSIVHERGCFYRRYSDDILIICAPEHLGQVEQLVYDAISRYELDISKHKTEKYLFRPFAVSPKKTRLVSMLLKNNMTIIGKPLSYLGFEFYGTKALIKSANLAKFYRRMISSVKRKALRAKQLSQKTGATSAVIFRGRLLRKYSLLNLRAVKQYSGRKSLAPNTDGTFRLIMKSIPRRHNTNYFSYVKRASNILQEPAILRQISRHRAIFNASIAKHLKRL